MPEPDISERTETRDFAEWILREGGWIVYARVKKEEWRPWTHYWPTGQKPEGIFRHKQDALDLMGMFRDRLSSQGGVEGEDYEIVLLRIGPEDTLT